MRFMINKEYEDRKCAPPFNYFVPTKTEAAALQAEAGDLRKVVDDLSNPWVELTRAEGQARAIETRLMAYRMAEKYTQNRSTAAAATAVNAGERQFAVPVAYFGAPAEEEAAAEVQTPVRPTVAQVVHNVAAEGGRYVECDQGGAFLWIANPAPQLAA